ncbi:MAG: glycosyltransferase family 4 protein [Tildeniella nuda ZEHNDER 1965/U140]|jgi:colanic acid biosynthesis glycosyl transferase WcaI|nr:glycosyltransferase family 4 protein [Tildeniella nuda ZEHNDER 1965/U140]
MQILIYSYNYYPEPIGIAPLMTELAESLATRGHKVRVVTGMPNYPERQIHQEYRGKLYQTEERNGVTVQRCYMWIRPQPGLVTRILLDGSFVATSFVQALRGWKPDIILLTIPPLPIAVPAAVLSWIYTCPVVLNLQDILPEAAIHVGLLKNKLAIRIFEALERFAYRTATAISVITPEFTENILQKGVPKAKVHCIPNWVDTNFIRPLPQCHNAFRARHGLEDKFVVLYSGNIALTQGLETVIEAATKLTHLPKIAFVIVGEEKALAHLKTICQATNANNILLLPFEPRETLPEMLAAADVGLVLQKRNVVGFNMPSKIQLLLASGRPIIASVPLQGAAAKTIATSGGGVVVEAEQPTQLADAIVELYLNPEQREKLGHQGRIFALENYEFTSLVQRYELLFSSLVNAPTETVVSTESVVIELPSPTEMLSPDLDSLDLGSSPILVESHSSDTQTLVN